MPTERAADRRLGEESRERLALLVLENQRRAALEMRERERPHRPGRIELGPKGQFVFQHPDAIGGWMLRRRHRYEDRGWIGCRTCRAPASPQHELAVLMKRRQCVTRQIHSKIPDRDY